MIRITNDAIYAVLPYRWYIQVHVNKNIHIHDNSFLLKKSIKQY